jgi:hypothetical protein
MDTTRMSACFPCLLGCQSDLAPIPSSRCIRSFHDQYILSDIIAASVATGGGKQLRRANHDGCVWPRHGRREMRAAVAADTFAVMAVQCTPPFGAATGLPGPSLPPPPPSIPCHGPTWQALPTPPSIPCHARPLQSRPAPPRTILITSPRHRRRRRHETYFAPETPAGGGAGGREVLWQPPPRAPRAAAATPPTESIVKLIHLRT